MPNRQENFHKWVVSIIATILILGIFSFIRTNTIAHQNSEAIARIEVVESEVQDIINQSFLDCPNRAIARHVLREVMLSDPDTTPALRALIETDFREITCK